MTKYISGKKIHLIGIGGSGMRAIAMMLLRCGAVVSGSDLAESAALDELRAAGVTIYIGQKAENIPDGCDRVVYSAAVKAENPEMIAAESRGLKRYRYSEMLGEMMSLRRGVAVAGTHGKSTTSAMTAFAMVRCGLEPSYIVGADVPQLGGPSCVGSGEFFVAEACEFERSFLDLSPQLGVILNVEEDHLDCYSDLREIIEAFRNFVARIPPDGSVIVNGDDRNAMAAVEAAGCEVFSFGLTENCRWRAVDITSEHGLYSYNAQLDGDTYARVSLSLAGMHNVYNSLAACAMLAAAGVDGQVAAAAIGAFSGAGRRMTEMGSCRGALIVDDFAHHPTEIQVTLRALRDRYSPRRLICVFQPHQHSRTRFLLKDFSRSFSAADEVIVPDIYFVRDSALEMDYISSGDLVSQIRLQGGQALYLDSFEAIGEYLSGELQEGDLLVTMGAGNVWKIAESLLKMN